MFAVRPFLSAGRHSWSVVLVPSDGSAPVLWCAYATEARALATLAQLQANLAG